MRRIIVYSAIIRDWVGSRAGGARGAPLVGGVGVVPSPLVFSLDKAFVTTIVVVFLVDARGNLTCTLMVMMKNVM
jgi:hypothetical protein